MTQIVDARKLACPEPVVLTAEAVAASDLVTVIVDNAAAVENVTRFARSKGFAIETVEKADGTYLTLRREGAVLEPSAPTIPVACDPSQPSAGKTVVFAPSDALGRGPAELGERLMGAFFHTLEEAGPKPDMIILMNTGVKLAAEGSRSLDDLKALEARGVEILACGTCLNYFELSEELAAGRVSNMYEIAALLLHAKKIVSL